MATTGFWPVKGRLKEVIDYAANPDKTTDAKFLDADLYAALRYAENDGKTDRRLYVSGVNCSKRNAYAQMMAVKRRFGERGAVVAYHGYQSFVTGEVTPEEAHAIGVETARRMWGGRFQVVVTTHLNTDNLHNHFVVNSVSFKDGLKFRNKIGDHLELRRISDAICRERGKDVLENADFYSHYGKSHREAVANDVREVLPYCRRMEDLYAHLRARGYTLSRTDGYKHVTVTAPGWKRPVRLDSIGFTMERVTAVFVRNREEPVWRQPPPVKRKYPLEDLLKKLDFDIDHRRDGVEVFIEAMFYVMILLLKMARESAIRSAELRNEARNLERYVADHHFLRENGLHTVADLHSYVNQTKGEIAALERERDKISNRIRRPKSPEDQAENKARRREVTRRITPLRQELRTAERILNKSPRLYDLLMTERRLEADARQKQRTKERTR